MSFVIYLIVSGCCQGPEASSQLDHLKIRASKVSQQFILYIFCPTQKGLNRGGWVNRNICSIVSGCYLGPKALSQLDHLKLRASKASQQFTQCIFEVLFRKY